VIEPNCRTRGAMGRHRYHCRPGRATERIRLIARLERCVFSGRIPIQELSWFSSRLGFQPQIVAGSPAAAPP
jgi:hypothetical protein